MKTWLTEEFNLKLPIIMAPMFLVTNNRMIKAAAESGIMGCIPALNWRTPELFEEGIKELKENCPGPFGINLIVNKSNIQYLKQLEICKKYVPDFVITSLGKPDQVIDELKPLGTKVFCDVVNVEFAQKIESLGADAVIAVNSGAGGHAGPYPPSVLIPQLNQNCSLPVISAGGIGTGSGLYSVLSLGAEGASIGSPFISVHESEVTEDYKDAIVNYGADDIGLTTKLSGTPCTVIKTPYVKKIGLNQNPLEMILNKNKQIKKFAKMLTFYKGMKALEKAALQATYKTVWCAGPSIEFIDKKESTGDFIDRLEKEFYLTQEKMSSFSSESQLS